MSRPAALIVVVLVSLWAARAQASAIDHLAWLQGCWITTTAETTVEEQWMAPRAGSMLGVGRTVRRGALASYELTLIREQGDGFVYVAHPSGQPSATFPSRTTDGSSAVFENPQHDFPQRVGYQRTGPDTLLAWIEGTVEGKVRRIEFPYRKAPCDAVRKDRD